ncbi:class I SAM-dependent methyltransferase [Achromobacter pulmonis]|uniref:Class I SAM-dependent methyltransferase n=2 Tax=Achromobacter pulmonis TaxID=1389932 RepID=A0A2N8K910_9BURK|nr:class I SAM-dependent methyltransferase [Achromobacter pulmonis]
MMFIRELWDVCPGDHAMQFSNGMLVERVAASLPDRKISLLDLGCGDGRSFDMFQQKIPNLEWKGLDIPESPEVKSRTRTDCDFYTFNGVEIPFDDESFDIVYSNQVFEHVRHPEDLLKEVARVLVRGGLFIGSVSYLQPFHSFSYFNFTPYGWYCACADNGLMPSMMAGGIDSVSLIQRDIDRGSFKDDWWRLSPFNADTISRTDLSVKQKNYRMLMFSGVIAFVCQRKLSAAGDFPSEWDERLRGDSR